uniref:Tail protein n=1 Tax=viral metagenome TaxID=1070528 RepID=A0A6H1ZDA5_9ZZZZ
MANYDTVKAGIAGILNGLGLVESSDAVDFTNAPVTEYGNRYILKALSGENQNNTIIDRFDDKQEWQILVAFSRNEQSDIIQLDAAHRQKDIILKAIDKPSNWTSFVKIMQYEKWEIIETKNYFVIDIRVSIMDLYIHG